MNFLRAVISSNRERFDLWRAIFFLAALVLGIIYVLEIESKDVFFYRLKPGTDMHTFYAASGKDQISLSMPLYQEFFLPLARRFLGPDLLFIRIFQMVFLALNCSLIYELAKRLFCRPAGICAGIIALFYPRFYIYAGVLLSETIAVFFLLLFFLFAVEIDPKKNRYGSLVASAVFLSLLVLARAKAVLGVFTFLVWLGYSLRSNRKAQLRSLGLAGLVFFLLIGIKNFSAMAKTGTSLFSFYNRSELSAEIPGPQIEPPVRFAFMKKAQELLLSDNLRYDNFPPRYYLNLSEILKIMPFFWGGIFPLGLVGIWVLFHRAKTQIFYVFFSGYLAGVLCFQVADRYRFLIEPVFIVFAAGLIAALPDEFKSRRRKFWQISGIALVGLLGFNFSSLNQALSKLIYPDGRQVRRDNTIVIQDQLSGLKDLRYKAALITPEDKIIKYFMIKADMEKIREAAILIDGYFLEGVDLDFRVNGLVLEKKWRLRLPVSPYLGTIKIPLLVSALVRGENRIEISSSTSGKAQVFIDTRIDYNRSAFYSRQNGENYDDLGSFSVLGDGEYCLALELKN